MLNKSFKMPHDLLSTFLPQNRSPEATSLVTEDAKPHPPQSRISKLPGLIVPDSLTAEDGAWRERRGWRRRETLRRKEVKSVR